MVSAPKRQRVVVLGSYGPSLLIFRGVLISALLERGHEVIAMAPQISAGVAQQLRAMGAEPREVKLANTSMNPASLWSDYKALRCAFAEIRPTTIIPYTIKPVTLGALAASQVGVRNVVPLITGLGYPFSEGDGAKRRISRLGATILYRLALARSATVIFQNKDDRDDFLSSGILDTLTSTAVVNGSGVDLDAFSPAALPVQPSFLMIARLTEDKGVLEFGEAASRLKKKHAQATFRLAGWFDSSPAGISKEELARIVDGGVEYLGKLDDVRPAIAEASVFVLPSRYREGTPRSSLEAMAMGRAVITCDAPGCRETVVHGENGFLVQRGSVDEIAAAMESFIVNPAQATRMGAASRRLAEQRFDVHDVNAAIIEAAGL